MITKLLQNLSRAAGISTYQVGLLQSKAYRILNQKTATVLKPYKITPADWALLGLVFENKSSEVRLSELAISLGVEAPFITERYLVLNKLGLITLETSKKDKRVKYLALTAKGKAMVPKVDKELISAMRPLLKNVTLSDLRGYKHVLESIVSSKNS